MDNIENTVVIGKVYQHFKSEDMRQVVVCIAKHSETEEELVVYKKLYGDGSSWARPLAMFLEHVETENYKGPRFRLVDF